MPNHNINADNCSLVSNQFNTFIGTCDEAYNNPICLKFKPEHRRQCKDVGKLHTPFAIASTKRLISCLMVAGESAAEAAKIIGDLTIWYANYIIPVDGRNRGKEFSDSAQKLLDADAAQKFQEFIDENLIEIQCLTHEEQNKRLCKLAANLLIPPSGIIAVLKYGKLAAKMDSGVAKAISEIKTTMEMELTNSRQLAKVNVAKSDVPTAPATTETAEVVIHETPWGGELVQFNSDEALKKFADTVKSAGVTSIEHNGTKFYPPPHEIFNRTDTITKLSPSLDPKRANVSGGSIRKIKEHVSEEKWKELYQQLELKGYKPVDPEGVHWNRNNKPVSEVPIPDIVGKNVVGHFTADTGESFLVEGQVQRVFMTGAKGQHNGTFVIVRTPSGDVTVPLNNQIDWVGGKTSTMWFRDTKALPSK